MRVVTFGAKGHRLTEMALAVVAELGLQHIDHIDASDPTRRPPPADLYLSAGFTRIVAPEILQQTSIALNVHPSLLPAYGGSHPVYWAMYEGMIETGVTIHEMIEDVDAGPIVAQERMPIDSSKPPWVIYDQLTELARGMLRKVLIQLVDTGEVESHAQSGERLYRGPPYREIDRLVVDWDIPACEIQRRASLFPGWVNFIHAGERIFIRRADVLAKRLGLPGDVIEQKRRYWLVVAGDGMTARVWLRDLRPNWLRATADRIRRRVRSLRGRGSWHTC